MKDKYLREQLVKAGIVDSDCRARSSYDSNARVQANKAGLRYEYRYEGQRKEFNLLKKEVDMLKDYLKVEIVESNIKMVKRGKKS